MKGILWNGEEFNWKNKPQHYSAIHFHDDDIYNANWKKTFEWTIPKNIRSGVIKNPPPTPNKPESIPTTKLRRNNKGRLTYTSAIGRKYSISINYYPIISKSTN